MRKTKLNNKVWCWEQYITVEGLVVTIFDVPAL